MEFEMIAKTLQGLENILAEELTRLGANNIEIGRRMVSFTGDLEMMYRANVQLRTAIRILKPIKHFRAKTADEVYDAVKAVDWTQYLTNRTTFAVDSVVYSSEFRHSKMVAYKVKDAIVDQMREKTGDRPNIRLKNPDLQLHIQLHSGARLFGRESAPSRLSSGTGGSTAQRSVGCRHHPDDRMARRMRFHRPHVRLRHFPHRGRPDCQRHLARRFPLGVCF